MNNRFLKMIPMLSCKKASMLISVKMDRQLTIKERLLLMMHVLMCKSCAQVMRQIKGIRKLVQAYGKNLLLKSSTRVILNQSFKEKLRLMLSDQRGIQ